MQNRSFDATYSSFDAWAVSLDDFKKIIQREPKRGEPLGSSDGAGIFWTKIRNFMRFLSKKEKEDDPDVVRLRELFNNYANLEREDFRRALIQILDLCLKICQKFNERQTAR